MTNRAAVEASSDVPRDRLGRRRTPPAFKSIALPGETWSAGEVAKDRGCEIARRCTGCPLRTCVYELPTSEREQVRAAWRLLLGYVAPVD